MKPSSSWTHLHVTVHRGKLVHFPLLSAASLLNWLVVVVELIVRHVAVVRHRSVGPVVGRRPREARGRMAQHVGRSKPWWWKHLT